MYSLVDRAWVRIPFVTIFADMFQVVDWLMKSCILFLIWKTQTYRIFVVRKCERLCLIWTIPSFAFDFVRPQEIESSINSVLSGGKRATDYEPMLSMEEEMNQKPHLSFIQIASPMQVPTDTTLRAYARPGKILFNRIKYNILGCFRVLHLASFVLFTSVGNCNCFFQFKIEMVIA